MLSSIKTNLGEKLKNRAYRAKFFRGRAQDEIALQLRAARKKRDLTQPKLEKLSGMKQSAISRIEQATYSHWNFQSLLCLADAMDLRVRVVFDYAEKVIAEYEFMEKASKSIDFTSVAGEDSTNDASGNVQGQQGIDPRSLDGGVGGLNAQETNI